VRDINTQRDMKRETERNRKGQRERSEMISITCEFFLEVALYKC